MCVDNLFKWLSEHTEIHDQYFVFTFITYEMWPFQIMPPFFLKSDDYEHNS